MACSFFIRTTTEGGWRQVRQLRIENATGNPISSGATLETTRRMTEEDWRLRARRGEASDATSLVAIEQGAPERWIGMMSAQSGDEDGEYPVLTGVYVTPAFRGRVHGVADALLDHVSSWADGRGQCLRLYVYEHATPARRFYARHGFVNTGRTRALGFTEGSTLEMVRPLQSGFDAR